MPQKTVAREAVKHRLTLKPVPPFDFDLSATIFSRGDPEFRNYEDGRFQQAVRVNDAVALLTLRSAGTVEEPVLKAELKTNRELSRKELDAARRLITRMFNLDFDLRPFYKAAGGDPVMARFIKNLYGLKSPTTPTVYEALVDSIIEQQISLIAAHTMQNRLIRKFGERLTVDSETFFLFPIPESLAGASIAALKSCGLSGRKAEYIKEISQMVVAGTLDLDKFDAYDDIGTIRDELKAIRGIGNWTAEMTMIRGLHKMDSFPADDIGLQAKMSHDDGKEGKASSDELRQLAENWGKYRGLGGYYMIMAHHIGIEPTVSWPQFWGRHGGYGRSGKKPTNTAARKAAGGGAGHSGSNRAG